MFRVIAARSEREIADAQGVRFRVYCQEEALLSTAIATDGRERDARDFAKSTTHLVAYADEQPVGTVRLCQADTDLRQSPAGFGLDLEATFALRGFEQPGLRLAEVTRYCVLRRYRGTRVAGALFAALRSTSQRLGVTHWVAAANAETDCAEDAAIAYRLIQRSGLLSPRYSALAHGNAEPSHATRFAYSAEERQRAGNGDVSQLRLPKTLALFAHKLGARYLGAPAYDPHFNVFATPLTVELASLAAA